MVKVKVNNSKVFFGKLGVVAGILSLSTVTIGCFHSPAYAGAQSLLDPYANIQPPAGEAIDSEHSSNKKTHAAAKLNAVKSSQKNTNRQVSSTANSAAANPGFLSGLKEIQHGSVVSFKAAGHGIVNGSKVAGTKIAVAGGKVKDGIVAAGHKIMPGQQAVVANATAPKNKKKNHAKAVATANSQSRAGSAIDGPAALPGKPLGPVANTLPHAAKVKSASVGAPKQKNIVARTFDKINPFAKHKTTNADIANNGVPH